ncbi:MAG: glutamate-5-semialdehyde dehydrogenase [Planctomycetaceae bacterium]|nr:glutamate-5-semialdehyde dehydrogenase [Planctomycetaceae bacterium]
MTALAQYCDSVARKARSAAITLATVNGRQKDAWLAQVAGDLRRRAEEIVSENARDLAAGEQNGLSSALLDRLKLTPQRIESLARAVEEIIALPDPVGEVIDGRRRPNGLTIEKIRVPLGVIFFIYESRPNVTIDAAALCIKSGNSVILRGGKEAIHSNQVLAGILGDALVTVGLPREAAQLVETTDRQAVGHFLKAGDLIDVTIPRGGRSLIERVTAEATMPVIKHYDGICHVYVDAAADEQMATDIVVNSKCQRPGVCNALETLLIHREAAQRFWPALAAVLRKQSVELRCCPQSISGVEGAVPVTEEDYATEYLDLILSVRIVDSIDQAIEHIRRYGSAHTDAIVTSDLTAAMQFESQVDSSAVMINASTRFNDGGEFGLGAEIGISTDRFHARGPCGLREITSYKYVVRGQGQTRG